LIRYLELASLRWLLRHRWQLAAAVLGVALGLACVVGIELAARSALASFERQTRALAGRATHTLTAGPEGLDEREYARLVRAFPEVDLAPLAEHEVRARGAETLALVLTGVDPLAEARVRGDSLPTIALGDAVRADDALWLARATARELGIEVGAPLALEIDGRAATARLAGVLDAPNPAAESALRGRAFADLATVQRLCSLQGRLTRVDVVAPSPDALARLEASLPAGSAVEAVSARAGELERMSRAMRFNLRALALLALFVGAFLVYDTSTFSVVQRRELFGRMRALGADRATLFATVAHEALWIGLAGSTLGLALGIAVARVLVAPLAQTLTDLYAPVSRVELDVSPAFLAGAAALGVLATLLGALLPAWEAAASPPRQVLARSFFEARARGVVAPLAVLAATFALLAWGLLANTETLFPALLAVFAVFAAAGCGAPAATVLAARLAARAAVAFGGTLERIAARSVEAALSRTAVAVAALAVALGASLAMGTMVASLRGTLSAWLESAVSADVFVWAPHRSASRSDGTLDPELVAKLRALYGVEQVATTRGVALGGAVDGTFVIASEQPPRSRAGFRFVDGEPERAWADFDAGAVLVSEAFARARSLAVGDALAIPDARAGVSARVAGVFQDYATDRGYVLVARSTYQRWFDDPATSGVGLFLAPGVDPEAVVARIRTELAPERSIGVHSNASLRAATYAVFDRTFAVARALELFAALIAALACVSSLAALEFERARELALLRAEGLDPRGVVRLILGRSALVGVTAAALAVPLGLGLAALLVFEMQPRAFGWTLAWSLARGALLRVVVLSVAAAVAAGIAPAWSALRSSPARALTEE
jgi:putative ABC transport system permease protein